MLNRDNMWEVTIYDPNHNVTARISSSLWEDIETNLRNFGERFDKGSYAKMARIKIKKE